MNWSLTREKNRINRISREKLGKCIGHVLSTDRGRIYYNKARSYWSCIAVGFRSGSSRTRSLARILVEPGHEGLVTGEPGLEAQITGKLTRRILRGKRRETTMVNRRSRRTGGGRRCTLITEQG